MRTWTHACLLVAAASSGIACSSLCTTGECSEEHAADVILGSVKDLDSGKVLTEICMLRSDYLANSPQTQPLMKVHASEGARLEEQVVLESRTERYSGTEPDRGQSFWCGNAPKVDKNAARRLADINSCLVVADADPPAKIVAIDPRGAQPGHGLSAGYALNLEVLHRGVLHIVGDDACRAKVLGLPMPDGAPSTNTPWAELEVL